MKTDSKKLVADTNIILYVLDGNDGITAMLRGHEVFISVISELEILRFASNDPNDFALLKENLRELKIIEINEQIKQTVYHISALRKIKLSDCIIAATAAYLDLPLITADKRLENLPLVNTILVNL